MIVLIISNKAHHKVHYIAVGLESISGKCHGMNMNTSVVIEYKDGQNITLNKCAEYTVGYAGNVKHITVFLWFTDVVSVFAFDELSHRNNGWYFNVTV